MTREEAIRIFRKEIECLSHTKCEDCILEKACDPMTTTPFDSEYIEAYNMAIKALEQEPCEDAISRQAVIKAITNTSGIRGDALNALYELPPVNPAKKGRWIYQKGYVPYKWKCNQCSADFKTDFKYCPNCGAKMVEPQESEDKE